MPLLRLAPDAVVDTTDETGIILDAEEGCYFELNTVATLMVAAAIRFDSVDEVIDNLREQIDATDEDLRQGLDELIGQLAAHRLIVPTAETP
jgi:Coenzyme PQQ synthesis protein D (PqqD)